MRRVQALLERRTGSLGVAAAKIAPRTVQPPLDLDLVSTTYQIREPSPAKAAQPKPRRLGVPTSTWQPPLLTGGGDATTKGPSLDGLIVYSTLKCAGSETTELSESTTRQTNVYSMRTSIVHGRMRRAENGVRRFIRSRPCAAAGCWSAGRGQGLWRWLGRTRCPT